VTVKPAVPLGPSSEGVINVGGAVVVPAKVQQVGTSVTGGTLLATGTVTVPAGGCAVGHILTAVSVSSSVAQLTGVTDSRGNAWTVHQTIADPNGVSIASCVITTALLPGDTITLTFAGTCAQAIIVDEWSGISTSSRVDVVGTGTTAMTTTTAATSPTLTAQAGSLVIGAFAENWSDALAAGSGYALEGSVASTTTVRGISMVYKVSPGGAETPNGTWAQAGSGTGASIALRHA
jgi:hypothetical protein